MPVTVLPQVKSKSDYLREDIMNALDIFLKSRAMKQTEKREDRRAAQEDERLELEKKKFEAQQSGDKLREAELQARIDEINTRRSRETELAGIASGQATEGWQGRLFGQGENVSTPTSTPPREYTPDEVAAARNALYGTKIPLPSEKARQESEDALHTKETNATIAANEALAKERLASAASVGKLTPAEQARMTAEENKQYRYYDARARELELQLRELQRTEAARLGLLTPNKYTGETTYSRYLIYKSAKNNESRGVKMPKFSEDELATFESLDRTLVESEAALRRQLEETVRERDAIRAPASSPVTDKTEKPPAPAPSPSQTVDSRASGADSEQQRINAIRRGVAEKKGRMVGIGQNQYEIYDDQGNLVATGTPTELYVKILGAKAQASNQAGQAPGAGSYLGRY